MKKILITMMTVVAMMMTPVMMVAPAWAAGCTCTYKDSSGQQVSAEGYEVNLLDLDGNDDGCYCPQANNQGTAIVEILLLVINILSSIVMVAAVIGVLIVGIQYLTARDNEGQVVKAKMRLLQIVIGIAVFALTWVFLQWIIPGGVINKINQFV